MSSTNRASVWISCWNFIGELSLFLIAPGPFQRGHLPVDHGNALLDVVVELIQGLRETPQFFRIDDRLRHGNPPLRPDWHASGLLLRSHAWIVASTRPYGQPLFDENGDALLSGSVPHSTRSAKPQ